MSVLFVLVPVALLLVGIFVAAYAWSSRSGQFDDLTTPAMRALHEDPAVVPRGTGAATGAPGGAGPSGGASPSPGPPAAR